MSLLHKKEKQNKNNDPLIRLMTPMIAGILVCTFCLVSMTWAWFSASVDTPALTIQSASRSTSVKVYEISQTEDENRNVTKTLVRPQIAEELTLAEDTQTDAREGTIIAGETAVWELAPEKTYEVVLTGEGDASKGYCKVALYHNVIENDEITPKTELYNTKVFGNKETFSFTYNTGGFNEQKGLTATQWKEYVEKTEPPTLTIASFWGEPQNETPQVALMSLRRTAEEEIMLLSDGDVLGLAPIPCPEAKAETEVDLEGFEVQEGAVISAEEDYQISLTLKEGYEMPCEVVINIDGKDYVVSTGGADACDDAPYYDAEAGVLTVPSSLLSDGTKVSVKATATLIPVEEETEEETEEATEETTEETTETTENQEDNSADTSTDTTVVVDNPTKKEDDSEQGNDEPDKTPASDGGNNDDDDEADDNSEGSFDSNDSPSDNNEVEAEDEKANVTLNLSQLTINLEETKIPTNADLVLTLSAKEDMELPESIVITLDKTIRDENIDDEEIEEDKTEYIINTNGKDNPEGFEFDAESGELTISSKLLEGVREIKIADTKENEVTEDDEKATLTFEVKNLTFDFTDGEVVTDEDVVIIFTAGEGYELPETIIITIDGEEYIIYTSEEDSGKNPEGIIFDIETGTLTISKDLLEDAKAITIAAEGVEKEDEESEDNDENPDADKKDESEDKVSTDKENEGEGGEAADKETESGTDAPDADDKTETEGGTDTPNTEDKTETEGGTDAPGEGNTETTNPETNPDNTTEGEDEGKTETSEPGPEPTTPAIPGTEDNANAEQGGENVETEVGGDAADNKTEESTPDTESGDDGDSPAEPSEPTTEPTTPAEPSEPVVTPETPKTETPDTSESETSKDGDDSSGTANADSSSVENSSNSGNDSAQSNASSENTTPTAPTTSEPAASKTNTPSSETQASVDPSSTPASTPSTNNTSSEARPASATTTSLDSKETSSEE